MKSSIKVLFTVVIVVLLGCKSSQQASAVSFSQPNKTYYVTSRVVGEVVVGNNSTLVFSGKGMLSNATVKGQNIKIVSKVSSRIFLNCNFTGATFASCTLQATNFGMKSDMKSRSYNYTLKGIRYKTNERYGTDNTQALKMMAQFLSNSKNVKINFNGSFFSASKTPYVTINGASGLELYGPGTLIMGIALTDCYNCSIHDLNFVGYHTVHDFPPVYASKFPTVNGVEYNKDNAYNVVADGTAVCGLGGDAIQILPTKTDASLNRNFTVKNIHFEMRRNGLAAGKRSDKLIVRDVTMSDCTFDHIYFQPVGLHITGGKVSNVHGQYCLQGVDMSAGTNNVTVSNSTFNDCAMGPKQESTVALKAMSHHNVLEGCTFGINEKYFIIDAAQYILNVAEGPSGDTFTVRNTTFNVKKNRILSSVMTRAYRTVLDNVTINVDVTLDKRSTSNYSMNQMFAVYGETAFEPQLELNNVTVNLASGTNVNLIVTPGLKKAFNLTARNLTVNGAGTVGTYFENMALVDCQDCALNIESSTVASRVTNFKATRLSAAKTQNFVLNNVADAKVNVSSCNVIANTMVNCREMPADLNLSGNNVTITGSQAITGVQAASVNANKFKVSNNTFKSNGKAIKVMDNAALKKLPAVSRNNTVK